MGPGWRGLLLLGLLALAASQRFAPYPSITNETFIKQYVDTHNKFRSEVKPSAANMRYMSFDIALARIAKAYAQKCTWGHNPNRRVHPDPKFKPFGENIWRGVASKNPFNIDGPLAGFHSEIKYYNFSNHHCTRRCGHYTQIVWANTYKVGCAIVFCAEVPGKGKNLGMLVCDYAPAGNYKGVRPYKEGTSCSECRPGDTCENNLCKNPERDQLRSYVNWSLDWDITTSSPKASSHPFSPYPTKPPQKPPHSSTSYRAPSHTACDSFCIAVLISRILSLLITVGTVILLSRWYPQMSVHE